MTTQAEIKKRVQRMLLLTCLFALAFLLGGFPLAVLGLVLGAAVSIFNYWLVVKGPWEQAGALLKRYLARIVLDGVVVIVTGLLDLQLLFGAVGGLTLEMQTYLLDAFMAIFRE